MPRILTTVLTLSWAAIFGILAISVLPGGSPGALSLHDLLGLDLPPPGGASSSAVVGYLMALFNLSSAVLFCWACAVSLLAHGVELDGGDDVNRVAFAAGAAALTLGLIAGALLLVPGLLGIAMISLAALVVSYVATFLERLSLLISSQPGAGDVRAAARLMALGAAHSSLLSRISQRTAPTDGDSPR